MGKNDGALWDDSSLIDAFEEALSSYKMMHKMKQIDGVKEEQEAGDDTVEEIAEEDAISHVVTIIATTSAADVSNSVVEATSPMKEESVDKDVSNGTAEAALEGSSNPQPDADYNSLVNHYYELQEKLQTTWQQLQQFGYPSDQTNAADAGLSNVAAKGGCASGDSSFAACCCCPCTSKCALYSSCPASVCKLCSDAVLGIHPGMSVPRLGDDDIIRTAMGAAEKAISLIKIQTSGQQGGSEDTGCEPDISTVLNAWFSAGLATGKYLTEQSNARRQRG